LPRPDLDTDGFAVTLPTGWDGEIYRRAPEPVAYDDNVPEGLRRAPTTGSIVHLANFTLPARRGDYGSEAVVRMGDDDILVILFEFAPESATRAMFWNEGIPRPLHRDDWDPNQMQLPLPPRAGVQRFFNVDGRRAFCLFSVIGNYARRNTLTPRVNEVLGTIEISA